MRNLLSLNRFEELDSLLGDGIEVGLVLGDDGLGLALGFGLGGRGFVGGAHGGGWGR